MTSHKDFTFGIEIETTGLNREACAAAIAASIPGAHVGWNGRTVVLADGREWKCVSDSSISGCANAEVVSPICTFGDMAMVQDVARALRAAGARTDASCGVHVHVGVAHLSVRALVNLVKITAKFEAVIVKGIELDPTRACWCKTTRPEFLAALPAVKTVGQLKTAWYASAHGGECSETDCNYYAASHYDSSRYQMLNLHSYWYSNRGTAEFRCFNGTLHAGKIRSYIMLCLAIVAKSANAKFVLTNEVSGTDLEKLHKFMTSVGMQGEEFDIPRMHLGNVFGGAKARHFSAARKAHETRRRNAMAVAA